MSIEDRAHALLNKCWARAAAELELPHGVTSNERVVRALDRSIWALNSAITQWLRSGHYADLVEKRFNQFKEKLKQCIDAWEEVGRPYTPHPYTEMPVVYSRGGEWEGKMTLPEWYEWKHGPDSLDHQTQLQLEVS